MATTTDKRRSVKLIVWIFRLAVGFTFIFSGLAKMIDVWGFIYKIEQYLAVWSFPQPRSLVLVAAMGLSGAEFMLGLFMATGCYKRTSAWLITAIMAVMLPLTFYIMLFNPVSDCGCFGDFIVISNGATFVKNLVLTAMLVYLLVNNRKVDGIFTAYSQWLVAFIAFCYILSVGLLGYHVQPLIDFRPFKVGVSLADTAFDDDDADGLRFIYEKNGLRQEFDAYSLPDSTWTFVERIDAGGRSAGKWDISSLQIFDGDDNVTSDLFASSGPMLMLLIPEIENVDVSSTYLINEMSRYISSRGGSMVGIIGADESGIDFWKDISMASYDIFTADDTAIKSVARGNVAVVYLVDGVIQWKRTLNSIDPDTFASPDDSTLDDLAFPGTAYFWLLTLIFIGAELVLFAIDRSGRAVKLHFSRRIKNK